MRVTAHQDLLSAQMTREGLHAQALLVANEGEINALNHRLKLLERDRHELCERLQGFSLTPNEINWLVRPVVALFESRNLC